MGGLISLNKGAFQSLIHSQMTYGSDLLRAFSIFVGCAETVLVLVSLTLIKLCVILVVTKLTKI